MAFREEIMNFLKDFRMSQKYDFQIMKEDVNQIKNEVTSINTAVENLVPT